MLASGGGTILQAMLDSGLPVEVVVVDRQCGATERAVAADVPVEFVERTSFGPDFDRVAYTHRVVDALRRHDVDLVAMAGFGTILEKPIHDEFSGRIVNTHPSLAPCVQGLARGARTRSPPGSRSRVARCTSRPSRSTTARSSPRRPSRCCDDDTVETPSRARSRRSSAASTRRSSATCWKNATDERRGTEAQGTAVRLGQDGPGRLRARPPRGARLSSWCRQAARPGDRRRPGLPVTTVERGHRRARDARPPRRHAAPEDPRRDPRRSRQGLAPRRPRARTASSRSTSS